MFSFLGKWASFVRFSHTVFALPFAVAAMVLAARDTRGWPGWEIFLFILAAMVCARTCAMAFNRIVDRDFDKENPRTSNRHLPVGTIGLASAVALCLASGAGLVASAWALNPLCFHLSPVALFFICFYSLTKRFTDFTHLWLGLALALAPIGAWLAVAGGFDFWPARCASNHSPIQHSAWLPLVLAVAVVFWVAGFDIIYAIQDFEFDRRKGLHSLVVRWGPKVALDAAMLAHMAMLILLLLFGLLAGFRIAFFIGYVIIAGCVVLEHLLARWRKRDWLQNSFFRLNAVISVVFLLVTVVEVVFPAFRIRL
jgi:4-hydroxybenzoate polyprenyltransferase